MSDESACAALRSDAPLVVVEAPAGCGKTHQGAEYAKDIAVADPSSRPLILTHTHAACSVFADRTKGTGPRVTIRTFDSIIGHVASAYHRGLGLPADTASWIRQRQYKDEDGYAEVAVKISALLERHPMIAASLARRHEIVVCDEHQDSSGDHHALMMALLNQGARVRVLADPMQKIFMDKILAGSCPPCDWEELTSQAYAHERLDVPHRWSKANGCADLGRWTLSAREILKAGGKVDLRNSRPPSVQVVFAENQAQKNLDYRLTRQDRKRIDAFKGKSSSLLVLTRHNKTALSLRGFFYRSIPLWEGHTRTALERLMAETSAANGDAGLVAATIVTFMGAVGKGFSPSVFGNRFEKEVRDGCAKSCKGKPLKLQELARFVVGEPNHRGIAKMLHYLSELKNRDSAFSNIKIDHHKEFLDAVRLGVFDSVDTGLAEITHRRTYSRPQPPPKAISTIHKAKGLECDSVVLMPCDAKTFPDKPESRCLLYVALSRPRSCLLLVLSRDNPSPLLTI